MRLTSLLVVLAGMLFTGLYASAETEAMPSCNAVNNRCMTWQEDSRSTYKCVDRPTHSSCTPRLLFGYGGSGTYATRYHVDCLAVAYAPSGNWAPDCDPNTPYRVDETEASYANEEEMEYYVDRSTYLGWRENTKMSATAVSNSSRAKLHACSQSGSQDESYYNTYSSCTANPFGETKHAKNVACTDSTWDTLCASWPGTRAE